MFRQRPNHSFTVHVHGSGGPQDRILKTGYVILDTGAERRRSLINRDGGAVFQEIPDVFWGKDVSVGLEADGYELADPKARARLVDTGLYLLVRKGNGHIAGQVKEEDGKSVADASIRLAGLSTSTDALGHFEFVIPGEIVQDTLTLRVEASGYAVWVDAVTPNANDLVITLHRLR